MGICSGKGVADIKNGRVVLTSAVGEVVFSGGLVRFSIGVQDIQGKPTNQLSPWEVKIMKSIAHEIPEIPVRRAKEF